MNKGKIIAGVTAVLIGSVSPAFFVDTGTVVNAEKVYDVKLSVETVEIDINDIPDNREVQVGVNVDNNPGYLALGFFIDFDSRLSTPEYRRVEYNMDALCINYGFRGAGNIIEMAFASMDLSKLYYDNGELVKINYIIPEDAKPGDFYYVKPFLEYEENKYHNWAFFRQENSFDNLFDVENFAEPVGGGIRITGQQKSETQAPEPSPSPSPSPLPSPSPKNEDKPSQTPASASPSEENKPAETRNEAPGTTAVSETVTTVTSSVSETVSETTTSVTTAETTVSETKVSTAHETTCAETSEFAKLPFTGKKTSKKLYIWPFIGAIAGVTAYNLVKKRKGKNSDR